MDDRRRLFVTRYRDAGLGSPTAERLVVAEHALGRRTGFTAESAVEALEGRVSRGTVYRTLAMMESLNLLVRSADGDTLRRNLIS